MIRLLSVSICGSPEPKEERERTATDRRTKKVTPFGIATVEQQSTERKKEEERDGG
jgi:hypothetical protein